MQRIQPRPSQDEKSVAADPALRNYLAVFPEENEAADAPENLDAVVPIGIKHTQDRIEGLLRRDEIRLHSADDRKVLVVEYQDRERAGEAQQFDTDEFIVAA